MPHRLPLFLMLTFVFQVAASAQNTTASVLSDGEIYKLSVPASGVYKLDYDYLSSTLGLDIDNTDPANIHIYGNPGGPVPQLIEDERTDDLHDLDIYIKGEEDGRFDPEDYILVYIEGADRYVFTEKDIRFEKNVYDLNNYLFLKIEPFPGPRVMNFPDLEADFYTDEKLTISRHENEWSNLLADFSGTQGSGKQWFGEAFANLLKQDFSQSFTFPGLVPGKEAQLEAVLTSRSDANAQFEISVGNQSFLTSHSGTRTGDIEALYARSAKLEKTLVLTNTHPAVTIEYLPNAANSEGWLDYLELRVFESIIYNGAPIFLFNPESLDHNSYGFRFESTNRPFAWNITDQKDIYGIELTAQGNQYTFGYDTDGMLQGFVVFDPDSELPEPAFVGMIANQNLHGITEAEFLVVYHPEFRDAAEILAAHRSQHDLLNIKLANIFDIYNEFGGGRTDPGALRDFVRMIYKRDADLKYLLLMGDATYDFRGIDDNVPYHNFVPTYQTLESLNPIEAFPSDDFFALLSDNEGDESLNGALDIGVGRIPCTTAKEALDVVNKIIHYDSNPACFGEWRMRLGFAADDQDKSVDRVHVSQADGIAQLTALNHPEFNQQKFFFDAFPQVSTPGGQRYPDARNAINENINKGMLVMGYLGHGGPKGLAQERVLQISDINSWKSLDNLPILITATCSFTGFDNPTFRSAGEHAVLNPSGGAIALFSTVRAVYSSSNKRLTEEVYKKLFDRSDGNRLRFGDIIKESQNANSADTTKSNSRKFMLIGDPSLTIAIPKHHIIVDQINGESVDAQSLDTIGALSRTSISGSIRNSDDQILNDFNGELFLTVYDKKTERKTLDNDNQGSTYSFDLQNSVLYKGRATVSEGRFHMEFILPKDINFEYGTGKLSMYATDNITTDAGGYYDKLIIGGISETALTDNEGPKIDIFMDDRSFVSGDLTGPEPRLIVDLADENGINLSSTSIGHDITATLDNRLTERYILNDFYTPALDRIGAGTVEYNLTGLAPGLHQIRIKAWDILNNSAEETVEFFVTDDESGFVKDVINYPNPVYGETWFAFNHDMGTTDLDVRIDIFSISGQHITTLAETLFSPGSRVDGIYWDGKTTFGDFLANGVYIYKIKLFAPQLNLSRESDFHKLVILN